MNNPWSISGNEDPWIWREKADMERFAVVEQIRIIYPRLRSLLEDIDQCAQSAADPFPNQLHSPLSLAIAGQTGVGKTVLAKFWLAEAMRKTQMGETKSLPPYQYVSIPAMTSQKGLLAAFLCAVTDSDAVSLFRGTTWTMEARLSSILSRRGTSLIIVDNCEHLIRHQSRHISDHLIELLVRMASQCHLSLILLGECEAMEQIIDISPKLERRVGSPLLLAPFRWDRNSLESVMEWRTLLSTLDRALPFDESGLAEEDLAHCLIYATDGVLGWLMNLISFAARKAIFEESATLRWHHLADAYNRCIAQTPMGRGKVNPFSKAISGKRVQRRRARRMQVLYSKEPERPRLPMEMYIPLSHPGRRQCKPC